MKQILLLALFSATTANAVLAQPYVIAKDTHNEKNLYKGFITDSLLQSDTASCKWFSEAKKIYTPQDKVVKIISSNKTNINFLVFMGTWCDDSHFVIPRFFTILETAGYDKSRVTLVAVDRNKKDISNLANTLSITNVPTIIVYKNGKELGRVVEYGTSGRFDEELAAIINEKK